MGGGLILISLACFTLLVVAQWQFEGEWVISPSASRICDVEVDVEVTWIDLPWSASLRTQLESEEWKKQTAGFEWSHGEFALDSSVVFEPSKGRFKEWKTKLETHVGGWKIDLTSKITRTSDWFSIDAEWSSDGCKLDTRFRWRCPSSECGFTFYDVDCEVEWVLRDVELSIEGTFTDEGFDELVIEVENWEIEAIPGLMVDIEMTRWVDGYEVEIAPTFEGTITSCIAFEGRLLNTLAWRRFGGGVLDEWTLDCEVSSWTIEATAYLTEEALPSDDARFVLEVERDIALGTTCDMTIGWEGRYHHDETGDFGLATVEGCIEIERPQSAVTLGYVWDVEDSRLEEITLEFEWDGDRS